MQFAISSDLYVEPLAWNTFSHPDRNRKRESRTTLGDVPSCPNDPSGSEGSVPNTCVTPRETYKEVSVDRNTDTETHNLN